MAGRLRSEFELPDFWIKSMKGDEFNPEDIKAFIKDCVPYSFQDPIEPHICLICKDKQSLEKAKRARKRASHSTPYPDEAVLVNIQSWYDIWIRPYAGKEDPLGLWILLAWMYSEYRIKIIDDLSGKRIG